MEFLSQFIEVNRDVIFFVYGLAFFLLGMGIALQTRRHSRLDLASSLKWLAAFGVTHGFYEWGDVFIPLQEIYLSTRTIVWLDNLHSILLIVSFLCLLQFGISLFLPLTSPAWLPRLRRYWPIIPIGLMLIWGGSVVYYANRLPDANINTIVNALGRYFLAFPGALLAAFGLRSHAQQRIAALNVPSIIRNLKVASWALFAYALLAGLIPPQVAFFPGDWLNTTTFREMLGVPVVVFRSLIALVISISIIRAMEVFEVETLRFIESMEQQQILAAERQRLARDLHDGAIQSVYSAGLLVEAATRLVPADTPAAARLQKAIVVLDDTVTDLRRNLNSLKAPVSEQPIRQIIEKIAVEPRLRSLVSILLDLKLPEDLTLRYVASDHISAIVYEALSNTIRHSQAQNTWIAAGINEKSIWLTVQDDGIGMPGNTQPGNGIANMTDRAHLLGGELRFETLPNRGVCLRLEVPLEGVR